MGVIKYTEGKTNYSKLSDISPSINADTGPGGIDGAWRGRDKPVLKGFEFRGFTVSADMVEAILELDEERKNKSE